MALPAAITSYNPGNALKAILAKNPKAAGFNIGEYIADLAAGLQNVKSKEADLIRNEADIRGNYERDYGEMVVNRANAMRDLASTMGSRGLTHSGINLQEQAQEGGRYQRGMDRLLAQRNTGLEGIIGGRQTNIGAWNAFRNQVEAALAGDAAEFAAGKTVTGAGMPKELPWGLGTSSGHATGMTGSYGGQRMAAGPPRTSASAPPSNPPGIQGGFSPAELRYLQALERNEKANQLRTIAAIQTAVRNTQQRQTSPFAGARATTSPARSASPGLSNIPGVRQLSGAVNRISGGVRPSGSTRTPNVTGVSRRPTRQLGGGGRFYS